MAYGWGSAAGFALGVRVYQEAEANGLIFYDIHVIKPGSDVLDFDPNFNPTPFPNLKSSVELFLNVLC